MTAQIVSDGTFGIHTDLIPLVGAAEYAGRLGQIRVDSLDRPKVYPVAFSNKGKYLSADEGGGGSVLANIDSGKVRDWEIFELAEREGKQVSIAALREASYWTAINAGGVPLRAFGKDILSWERFTKVRFKGNRVALLAPDFRHYISASAKELRVDKDFIGPTEIFAMEYR